MPTILSISLPLSGAFIACKFRNIVTHQTIEARFICDSTNQNEERAAESPHRELAFRIRFDAVVAN
jgi:hypothetical protein